MGVSSAARTAAPSCFQTTLKVLNRYTPDCSYCRSIRNRSAALSGSSPRVQNALATDHLTHASAIHTLDHARQLAQIEPVRVHMKPWPPTDNSNSLLCTNLEEHVKRARLD